MEAHKAVIIEMPEQSGCAGPSRDQIQNRTMLGFKRFDYAAITIAEVELLRRIHKG
jgi:hypothetical protein